MTDRPAPDRYALAVRFFRALRNWSQEDFARAAGLHPASISFYETGRSTPPPRTLSRLAAAAGLPPRMLEQLLALLRAACSARDGQPAGSTIEHTGPLVTIAEPIATARSAAGGVSPGTSPRTGDGSGPNVVDRVLAPQRLARLLPFDPEQQRFLVENAEEYRSFALCELVCEESVKAAADGVDRALDLAKLALFIAERALGNEIWRDRLQGYAWAFIGNARRVGSNLKGAEHAFATAHQLWEAGAAADPGVLDASRLLDLEASLCRALRRWSEALQLLDRALALSHSPEATGRILLNKAFTHEQMGDCEEAIAALERAASLVDGRRNPRQPCVLRFNLGVNLCHLGRHAEAAVLVAEAREIATALRNDLDLVRVLWLEARVEAGLGRRAEAIAALRQVRADFAVRELPYDAALTSLDLAILLLEEGHNAEARELAEEMVAIFENLEVYREALAAVGIFQRAVEQEAATAELGRRLLRYLERARHDPDLRFDLS